MTGLTSYSGGHGSCSCLLTGINTVRNARTLISVDQQLAAYHGSATRFPSLVLGTVRETGFGGPFPTTLSWSRNKTPITPENRPEVLFEKLFGSEDNNTLAAAKRALAQRGSLLDSIKEQAAALQRRLGKNDRERLAQYFSSIRDLEERIRDRKRMDRRPKPKGGSARTSASTRRARTHRRERWPRLLRIHSADVRRDRAGVPDRQHAVVSHIPRMWKATKRAAIPTAPRADGTCTRSRITTSRKTRSHSGIELDAPLHGGMGLLPWQAQGCA